MVISQPAVVCLDATRHRILRAVAAGRLSLGGWVGRRSVADTPNHAGKPATAAEERPVSPSTEPAPLPVPPVPLPAPLSATERRARAAAVRGLMLARQRRLGAAQSAFAEAAALDPALDLAAMPTFWELHRGGQEVVVRAYEEVGRVRDAAMLQARLRQTFRPRPVPNRPVPAPRTP